MTGVPDHEWPAVRRGAVVVAGLGTVAAGVFLPAPVFVAETAAVAVAEAAAVAVAETVGFRA